MKKILLALAAAVVFLAGPRPAYADPITYSGNLVDQQILSIDANYDLDLKDISSLSMVATYSTATLTAASNVNFDDGRKSTATLTVSNYAGLIAKNAGVRITIASASIALDGQSVTLNGVRFREGEEWTATASTSTTATALAAAIDAHADFIASAVGSVVIASAAVTGERGNSYTAAVSTVAMTLSGSTFADGQNDAIFTINGVLFKQGTDFTAATSNAVTAENIENAIVANASLAAIFTATHPTTTSVVYATATKVGVNAYTITTSTPPALRVNGSASAAADTFLNGLAPDIDIDSTFLSLSSDTIQVNGHGLKTGEAVLYRTLTGTAPGGLTTETTYYAIRTNNSQFQLATTKANASAGTALNLTTLTGNGTFRLLPIAMSGTAASFKWQVSNDGTNFFDVPSISSFTWSAAGSTGWDFGSINYRYLRLRYLAPATFGGIDLTVTGNGRD